MRHFTTADYTADSMVCPLVESVARVHQTKAKSRFQRTSKVKVAKWLSQSMSLVVDGVS